MAITVNHSTLADGSFSATGATAWDANHTLTGTLPITNGGTGASTLTGYVKGNGTAAMTASATIPSGDVSGLGTMATQNANAIAVTGGTINNTTIGATTASNGAFTYLSTSSTTSTTPVLSYDASNCNFAVGATIAGSYLQTVMQNKSATANASTNWAVSNNLGTDSSYYGEFGMNSSAYSSGTPADFFSINNGIYFSGHDGDITLGSGNGYKTYLAWGTTGDKAHVINASGAIGLNTNITGTSNFGTSGQVLTSAGSAATPTWTTASTGTVTSVATAGTVNGLTLTGGPITSTGTVTLGGTLDLSSPPTIGNTAPNTGKFTTLESTGTASLGTTSTTYVTITGDASYPMVKATGGTNTPLVLSPLGTGALQAQKTDSTATGGNARGANAVDWQTTRSGATQVASGTSANINGGQQNTASGFWDTVGGGYNNFNNGFGSVISGGYGNNAGGNYTVVAGGKTNTAGSSAVITYSTVLGGSTNTSSGYFNLIGGGYTNSGTSASAVTTQSATMNATTAVTLSGSNASIKVGQYITGTSIAEHTYVAAISGTALTLSQNASGSSTSTLSFYTPHGVVVGGGNNQATGSYSFIGGGGDAGTSANRNVASGDWSFVGGGQQITASGIYSSVLGGGNCSATNSYATCLGGAGNGASGFGATNLGGNGNSANGTYAIAGGFNSTNRSLASLSFAAGRASSQGDAQTEIFVLRNVTTDATPTVLTFNAAAAGTTTQIILPNNSAYYFKVSVIAGVTGAGNTKAWTLEGAIKRGAGVGTTAIVGTVTTNIVAADAGASTWTVTATADTTNGGLAITVTGQASTTIRWVAKAETAEMTF